MIRKVCCSFLFFCFLDLLVFSCCSNEYHQNLSTVSVSIDDLEDYDLSEIHWQNFQFSILVGYETEQISLFQDFERLQSTAYATTCDSNYTMINRAMEFYIVADEEINGFPAGEPVNSLFEIKNLSTDNIDSILRYINGDEYYSGDNYFLIFNQPIQASITTRFKLNIVLEDGQTIERITFPTTILVD